MKTCPPLQGATATQQLVSLYGFAIFVALGDLATAADPKEKQTEHPAIVFLVAGQSNAGGMGVLSPDLYLQKHPPLVPGSTASEAGLGINATDYARSYIWVPQVGFEPVDPVKNLKPNKPGDRQHGIELPVIAELEKRFPDNDVYVVKWGPGNRSLHNHWNPNKPNGEYDIFVSFFRQAMDRLAEAYPEVRVVGLYWDQGEADAEDNKANEYEQNLSALFANLREDTGIPNLPIFLRKHIFDWPNIDTIILAQEAVVKKDPHAYLLDINLASREENYAAWSFSPGNRHLSSKAFVELTKRLFDGPLRDFTLESFVVYETP